MTDPAAPEAARLAVLGSPIGHSRSPRIHRAAYEVLGLPWGYEAVECDEERLSGWLDERGPEWRGLSLTMPLKEEAHRIATVLDPVAEESGVVNTLLRLIGGRWAGFNTDVGGLAAAIREAGLDARRTIVLGAGATAVSAVMAARELGAEQIRVCARRSAASTALVARFLRAGSDSPKPSPYLESWDLGAGSDGSGSVSLAAALELEQDPSSPETTLVISTLPGSAGRGLEVPAALAGIPLFDVAYDPWPSPLAERWRSAGGEAHSGLGMLVHQALLQIRIFAGGDPALPLEREDEVLAAMRRAVVGE